MRSTRRPTIDDVARRAVVDRAVVSKVLNDDPSLRVREETRQRVRQAAKELGYEPNFHARRLTQARTRAIGLLVPEYRNPGFAEIIAGAEEAAAERDLLLWTASSDGYPPERHAALYRSGIVDALLIAGSSLMVYSGFRFVQQAHEAGLPIAIVNRGRTRGDAFADMKVEGDVGTVLTDAVGGQNRRRIG